MDDDVVKRIKEHISSFPAEQSHYSRKKNMNKLYFSPLLNVTKMDSLYLGMCHNEDLSDKYRVKKTSYNQNFCHTIHLSFDPKSNTCATCDVGDSNEQHKSNYYAAVDAMQVDRKTPTRDGYIVYITKINNFKSVLLTSTVVLQSEYSCL
ncbi:unnamed protein product [Euphydryas editha]|uniref:Uncharacterized protein n=1 Tax=Euphydryas editha TaxID=104508 RepID=A0AAU9TVF6_EUPED|nr:unnamed protein product [Euphydryas editha]